VVSRNIDTAPMDRTIIYVWNASHKPTQVCWYYPREDKKHPERGQWVSIHGVCQPLLWEPTHWGWTDEIDPEYRV
jgi:hypothetical protein